MRLGFIQTTIMEVGQPPSVQAVEPAMWVKSLQLTGQSSRSAIRGFSASWCSTARARFPTCGRR